MGEGRKGCLGYVSGSHEERLVYTVIKHTIVCRREREIVGNEGKEIKGRENVMKAQSQLSLTIDFIKMHNSHL